MSPNPAVDRHMTAVERLKLENEDLRRRLEEAEETLHAIQSGEVDAFVVEESTGHRIYTLEAADRPYRLFVEQMQQGAATVHVDGTIAYGNPQLAALLSIPPEKLTGAAFGDFVADSDHAIYENLLWQGQSRSGRGEARLRRADGSLVPVYLTFSVLPKECGAVIGVLVTDLTTQRHHEQLTAAHQALQLSESTRRFAMQAAMAGSWTWDQASGAVVWSEETYELFGIDPQTPASYATWRDALNPEDRQRADSEARKAMELGRDLAIAYRIRHPMRGERWLTSIGRVVDPANRPGYMSGITMDITEGKQAEEALRQSEALLAGELADAKLLQGISAELIHGDNVQALFAKLVDAAVTIMRSDFASIQMFYPERAPGTGGELRLLGQRGFDAAAVKFWEWVRADSDCACGTALRTAARCIVPDVASCEFMQGKADRAMSLNLGIRAVQSTPLISRAGNLVGMISTHWRQPHQPLERDLRLLDVLARQAADLVERVRSEQSLRESEERFRLMADALPVLVWVSAGSRVCTWFNKSWRDFIRRPLEELVGDGWEEDVHPDDLSRCLEVYNAHFDARRPFAMEYRLRRHDGEYRWVEDNGVPRFDAAGEFVGFIGSCVDFTDRRLAEESLRQADRHKDEFLAMLAHELRSPLSAIRNAAEVLIRTADSAKNLRTPCEIMARQAAHMVRQVDDLLDVSRVGRGKIHLHKERTELSTAIRQAVDATRPLCESLEHELTVTLPFQALHIYGDSVRLVQIVSNLLNNAYKFTERHGHISLALEQDGAQAVIRVRDTGIGLAADDLRRIFGIFAQVDRTPQRARDGLGLGLALVKNLVEMHAGTVEGHSDGLGQGSEFVVRLPLLFSPPPPAELPSDALRATVPLRILIVDDNRDAAESLAMLLKITGHEVDTAHDGLEAIDHAAAFRFDMILLDIGMPHLDGYQAARRIRAQQGPRCPKLVALTGWGQEEHRRRTQEAGFDAHLVKPVDLNALTKLLEESAPKM